MNKWMTVEKEIIRVRPLVEDDFDMAPEWYIPTAEKIVEDRVLSANRTMTLKKEHLDNLVEVWRNYQLWQDWQYTGANYYNQIRLAAQINISVDYRGCQNRLKKAKKVFSDLVTKVYTQGKDLVAKVIADFNAQTKRKVDDKNYWVVKNYVEQYTGAGNYPKLKENKELLGLREEIVRLKEEIHQKRLQTQKIERKYMLSLWEGQEGLDYPNEIREPVVAAIKGDLVKLDKGEEVGGRMGFILGD